MFSVIMPMRSWCVNWLPGPVPCSSSRNTAVPQARYPVAIEQCYSVICMVPELGAEVHGLYRQSGTLTVAGDSVGGNMATVMTIMAKYRKGPLIQKHCCTILTNACFDICIVNSRKGTTCTGPGWMVLEPVHQLPEGPEPDNPHPRSGL